MATIDAFTKLGMHKADLLRTGILNGDQVVQVRLLQAVLPIKKFVEGVDIDTERHRVHYDLVPSEAWVMDDQMKTQLRYMRWVLRNILWDDTQFILKQNGEDFYDSRTESE